MVPFALSAVLFTTFASGVLIPGASVADASSAQAATSARPGEISVHDLWSVRRLLNALGGDPKSIDEGKRVAFWAELSVLANAVAGGARMDPLAFGPGAAATTVRVLATPVVMKRDSAAYQLLSLGYSVRETADVVSGRISTTALDTARRMLMVGHGSDRAADFLDSQYKQRLALNNPPSARPLQRAGASRSRFDAAIEKYAGIHRVDAAIVRAIIGVESAFDPQARSHAGAVGLMQLMPATARALAVDPTVPEQNIEGGVRYFSELMRLFGRIDLALVAYNGGPGYARRYANGEAALYGETRDYVKRVLSRLQVAY